MPLVNSMVSSVMPRESYGRGYGISSGVSSLGRAGGPFVGGAIASWTGFVAVPFFVSAVLLAAAGIYLIFRVAESKGYQADPLDSG